MAMALPGRRASFEALVDEAANEESMGHWFVKTWCHGKLSAREIVEGARAHMNADSNMCDPIVQRLAGIQEHNAHRDITRFLSRYAPDSMPPTYVAKIPLWKPAEGCSELCDVPFCLPHEWLHYLANGTDLASWTRHGDEYDRKIGGVADQK